MILIGLSPSRIAYAKACVPDPGLHASLRVALDLLTHAGAKAGQPVGSRLTELRQILSEGDQRLSVRPETASAASRTDSESVGWAWIVRAISSLDPPNSITDTHSAMSSEAL